MNVPAMRNYSITLPAWTVGDDALSSLGRVCTPFGKTAVVIGGRKAMAAIGDALRQAARGVVEILDFRWYGGEASEENVTALCGDGSVAYVAPVGYGRMPIEKVIGRLKEQGYMGNLIAELFSCGDLKANLIRSLEWLRERV